MGVLAGSEGGPLFRWRLDVPADGSHRGEFQVLLGEPKLGCAARVPEADRAKNQDGLEITLKALKELMEEE
ncbi:MAG: hypothetical protein M1126_06320 [Candidatus Thermoplasmatota archaeon]|nr:hypothetical protein [Candidatus Thermoplasmatota archaeon]